MVDSKFGSLWGGWCSLEPGGALFSIACVKDASVADNLEVLGGFNQWNVSFSREAYDWEVDVFSSFFQVLHAAKVRRGFEDRLWWSSSKRGLFKVKLFFYLLGVFGREEVPLEECMADTSSSKGGFLCVVGGFGQNSGLR